jgi:two-component sensor histidine kinase
LADEVVGKSITILIPADHGNEEPGILKRIRAGERVEHYETKRRRKDGSLIDISLTVSPVRDGSGKIVGASKIARDISERKRAAAQRDLLVAELSHRVKNTLATVVSIARQSFATNPDAVEAQRSFNARIRALGQTHSRLAEANWSGVSLETVLLDEIAPYRHADGANFRAAGPVTMLSTKHALTLGMAMHELATNAAKYGALSTENGVVDVSWEVDGEQLQITWSESGGPRVTPPKRNGFGRLLIERVLASDLEGDVRMDFAGDGLKCTITVPLGIQLPMTETLSFLMPAR